MLQVTDAQLLAWLSGFVYPFFRILALLSAAPILSSRSVPVRARIGLAGLVALVVAPFVSVPPGAGVDGPAGWLLVAREVGIGLAIGFVARLVFAAFEIAGEMIGLQMGFSYAGYFDPSAGTSNAIGRTINTLALLSFVALNGPLLLVAAIVHSFDVFPIASGATMPWQQLEPVRLGADVFSIAITMALPFMALLLFVNLVLGVISRVAPQFNVISVGFPVTIGAGLLLLAIGLPLLEHPITEATQRVMSILVR